MPATIQVIDATGATQTVNTLPALGAATSANSLPIAVATDDVMVGSRTETAPASDTASSGLNGRLQRVAQRITSLIALLPAALGVTVSTGSLPIVVASDDSILGATNSAAPASDTAISNINGRLQRIAQRITSLIASVGSTQGSIAPATAPGSMGLSGGVYNSSAPALTNGQAAATQMDASGNEKTAIYDAAGNNRGVNVDASNRLLIGNITTGGVPGGSYSYCASGVSYAAYATPTDMVVLQGSNTKTIVITTAVMQIQSTAASLQTLYFLKRSAVDTGGTSTNPTPVKYDSNAPAASATVSLYTAIPSALGALIGTIRAAIGLTGTLTAAPGVFTSSQILALPAVGAQGSPVTLRGSGECFCLNWNGAAIPGGFTAAWFIEWSEF